MKWKGWKRAAAGDFLLLRGCFHHYDLWMLIVRLVTGLMTAVVRFFITIGIALLTLTRADLSPLPAWVERYTLLDSGSRSFHAAVKAYHHFNNPVFRVACWLLAEDSQRRRQVAGQIGTCMVTVEQLCGRIKWSSVDEAQDATLEAKHDDNPDTSTTHEQTTSTSDTEIVVRTRRHSGLGVLRWRLAIMLHRFPQLRYHRSHYLERAGFKKPNYWKQEVSRENHVTELFPMLDAPLSIATLEKTAAQVAAKLTHRSLGGLIWGVKLADVAPTRIRSHMPTCACQTIAYLCIIVACKHDLDWPCCNGKLS